MDAVHRIRIIDTYISNSSPSLLLLIKLLQNDDYVTFLFIINHATVKDGRNMQRYQNYVSSYNEYMKMDYPTTV